MNIIKKIEKKNIIKHNGIHNTSHLETKIELIFYCIDNFSEKIYIILNFLKF